jgi:hypothetical protein
MDRLSTESIELELKHPARLIRNPTDGNVAQSREIRWISFPLREDTPLDETVWVSVMKLDASWKKNRTQYIGPGGSGHAIGDRYKKFGAWLERGQAVWIPWVGLQNGKIAFTDGRHRYAWLRDHGMESMPIDVDPDLAEEMQKRFGTVKRASFCRYENG